MSDFQPRLRSLSVPNNLGTIKLGGEFTHKRIWSPDSTYTICTPALEEYGTGSPYEMNPQYYNPSPAYRIIRGCLDEVHPGPPYAAGGLLRIMRCELGYDPSRVFGKSARQSINNTDGFVRGSESVLDAGFSAPSAENLWDMGDLFTNPFGTSLLGAQYFPSLSAWGERAWSLMKPKLDQMNGFEALYESRDLSHMLKTSLGAITGVAKGLNVLKQDSKYLADAWRKTIGVNSQRSLGWQMLPKKAANHFLNHQFGWRPFISDLTSISNICENTRALIDELSNRNGVPMKRRVHLNREHFSGRVYRSVQGNVSPCYPVAIPWKYLNGEVVVEIWDEWSSDIYATGSFSFWRPEFDRAALDYHTMWKAIRRYLTVYGVRINPSTIWSVLPWAWLVSWVTNIGKHVQTLTDTMFDSITASNFYVMRKYDYTRTVKVLHPFIDGQLLLEFPRHVKTKQRDPASSSYGFSLTDDMLSPRQLAIVGAIGVTRQRRR